jgi:tRNA pseudouridine55 synthase
MYSAIKVKGKRLYESARKGEVVERKTRDVRVDAFEVERDATNRQLVHFKVECGKGTYVRTLAHDLGESLGSAAHLTALRRVRVGEYDVDDAWTIDMLNDACAPMVEAAEDAKAAAAAAAAAAGGR